MAGHKFSRGQLEEILNEVIGKTLGEVDCNSVFDRAKNNPKITGIAGDVIEQSVLGYPPDSKQAPDLLVDGRNVELKTTGIRKPKNKKKNFEFEAKEPMSITAVSPEKITTETFEDSSFWHKLENLLLVYYHYDSYETVKAIDYANFVIMGYQFHVFSEADKKILEKDWQLVRDFIKKLQDNYSEPKTEYPRISSELRKDLMYIDIAPKWPNRPRFRLKRSTISNIVKTYFGEKFEQLNTDYSSFNELDAKLHDLTEIYRGKTIRELIEEFNIPLKLNKKGDVGKNISEQIVVKMFGAKSNKISKIDLFNKIGITAKTVTQTSKGTKTEDTKLFRINFEEWTDKNVTFEESFIYEYFNNKFLFVIFEEASPGAKLYENKFIGFKRLVFHDCFIDSEVRKVWENVRDLIINKKLVEEIRYKADGTPIINRNGTISTSLNFPKSSDGDIFIRGSSQDSTKKTIKINGINMYPQYLWIYGKRLMDFLNKTTFI